MPGLPEPGSPWGRFRIDEQLGGSGSGRVYAAFDPELDRRVALKVLESMDPAAQEQFVLRSRAAAVLQHPRIIPVLGTGDVGGRPYVVMDLVDGGDLSGEIADGSLTLRRAESVVSQLAGALDRAHRAGLVHGGVAPDDVVCVTGSDSVYLTGWGMPGDADPPHHRAPEQLRGGAPGPASDIYALGCLLFECLTGRVPFPAGSPEAVTRRHLEDPRPKVTDLRPDLPPALDSIVAEAMAVDPVDRYATCRAMADALRAVVTGGPALNAPATPGPEVTAAIDATTVEAEPAGAGADEPPDDDDVTEVLPVADASGRRRVVDGAAFGLYEDEDDEGGVPKKVLVVLAVATVVVGVLVWRAVNTEAELVVPEGMRRAPAPPIEIPDPTADDLRLFLPERIDNCAPLTDQPDDQPPRVVLECPSDGVPTMTTFELFPTVDERDAAFDALTGLAGIPPADAGGDCALGRPARHDYVGVEEVGQVGCQATPERVDFVWTSSSAPVLASATGPGSFGDHYRAWAALVERTDARFPTEAEQALLEQLPETLTRSCDRDIDLNAEAGGTAAVVCRLEGRPAETSSWVQFPSPEAMTSWFAARQAAGGEPCRPDQPTRFEIDGTTGQVVCQAGSRPTVTAVRDGSAIGSVAVAANGVGLPGLLSWWESVGYEP